MLGMQPKQQKSRPAWVKAAFFLGLAIIAGPLLLVLFFLLQFSGGISGITSSLKSAPNPESVGIVKKREESKASINSAFSTLEESSGLTSYGASSHDHCYKGQNNWKVHDGYAYRCTYRVTRFYGFNQDFRTKMLDFEQMLVGSDWKPTNGPDLPIKEIMQDYYDKYYDDKDPQISQNFGGKYLVSDLPTPIGGYKNDTLTMDMDFAEKDTKYLFQIDYTQNITGDTFDTTYEKKNFLDINSVFQNVTQHNKYVLALSLQEDYFQN